MKSFQLPSKEAVRNRRMSTTSIGTGASIHKQQKQQPLKQENTFDNHVVKFVYSEAVERGFRKKFMCPSFGPLQSAGYSLNPMIDVVKLPELYNDYVLVSSLYRRNQQFAHKLREELAVDEIPRGTRFGKQRNSIISKRERTRGGSIANSLGSRTPSIGKLPHLDNALSNSLGGRSPSIGRSSSIGKLPNIDSQLSKPQSTIQENANENEGEP